MPGRPGPARFIGTLLAAVGLVALAFLLTTLIRHVGLDVAQANLVGDLTWILTLVVYGACAALSRNGLPRLLVFVTLPFLLVWPGRHWDFDFARSLLHAPDLDGAAWRVLYALGAAVFTIVMAWGARKEDRPGPAHRSDA